MINIQKRLFRDNLFTNIINEIEVIKLFGLYDSQTFSESSRVGESSFEDETDTE